MSEGARISQLIYKARQQDIQSALLRAQKIYGAPCGSNCVEVNYDQEVPLESDYLRKKVCPNPTIGISCELSSKLTQQRIQCVLDSSINPADPLARFTQYYRIPPPPPCPPVPTSVLNANLPKASTKCPVPNRPSFGLV
jgi:hypothetical protein